MSAEITVYAFETEGDRLAVDWTTMDVNEARLFARKHGYSLIARTYEYADSELIEDYRPGHNFDGTPSEEETPTVFCARCGGVLDCIEADNGATTHDECVEGVADDLAAMEDARLAERRGLR